MSTEKICQRERTSRASSADGADDRVEQGERVAAEKACEAARNSQSCSITAASFSLCLAKLSSSTDVPLGEVAEGACGEAGDGAEEHVEQGEKVLADRSCEIE